MDHKMTDEIFHCHNIFIKKQAWQKNDAILSPGIENKEEWKRKDKKENKREKGRKNWKKK